MEEGIRSMKTIISIVFILIFSCSAPYVMIDRVEDITKLNFEIVKVDTIYVHTNKYFKVYYK